MCGFCDVGGAEKMEAQEGTILSHPDQPAFNYTVNIVKEWYIKVDFGYHIELTIQEFAVSTNQSIR